MKTQKTSLKTSLKVSLKSVLMASALAVLSPTLALASGDWDRTSSMYEVPVPENLKSVAFFDIQDVRVRSKDGVDEIKYNLPLELTGVPNRIRLKVLADGTVVGSKAEGHCSEESCKLKYRDLTTDEAAVRKIFESRGIDGLELEQRLDVFQLFIKDPAGIIHRK